MDSDLEEVKFIDCPYCDKFQDADKTHHLNQHVSKTHSEKYEQQKESFPQNFVKKESSSSSKPNKANSMVDDLESAFPDHRLQKELPNKPFQFKCELCHYKFMSRTGSQKHMIMFHNQIVNQIGNTVTFCDATLHKQSIEKQSFKQRCSICLIMLSNTEPAQKHKLEKHPDVECKFQLIKGDQRENLDKLCRNTDLCNDWKVKYWKIDPILNDKIKNEDNDEIKDENMVQIPTKEYKKFIEDLNNVKNKAKIKDQNVKSYFVKSVEAIENYLAD